MIVATDARGLTYEYLAHRQVFSAWRFPRPYRRFRGPERASCRRPRRLDREYSVSGGPDASLALDPDAGGRRPELHYLFPPCSTPTRGDAVIGGCGLLHRGSGHERSLGTPAPVSSRRASSFRGWWLSAVAPIRIGTRSPISRSWLCPQSPHLHARSGAGCRLPRADCVPVVIVPGCSGGWRSVVFRSSFS